MIVLWTVQHHVSFWAYAQSHWFKCLALCTWSWGGISMIHVATQKPLFFVENCGFCLKAVGTQIANSLNYVTLYQTCNFQSWNSTLDLGAKLVPTGTQIDTKVNKKVSKRYPKVSQLPMIWPCLRKSSEFTKGYPSWNPWTFRSLIVRMGGVA